MSENKTPLLLCGMQGLGDNIHQRAILRQLMQRHTIWLESTWVAPYHDFVEQGLKIIRKPTTLRTQAKNVHRESFRFVANGVPKGSKTLRIWYPPADVRRCGSILEAMLASVGCEERTADFSLPIPAEWLSRADTLISKFNTEKPIMLYRPLVERTEWRSCSQRNPDHAAYARLFESIRERYYVVSVADLDVGKEWIVGTKIKADVEYHAGELDFEIMAAMFKRAALVFCSPGFAVALASSVATPTVCVFGGHESSADYRLCHRHTRFLGVDPIIPSPYFMTRDKTINLHEALSKLEDHVNATAKDHEDRTQRSADRLDRTSEAVHEPGRA